MTTVFVHGVPETPAVWRTLVDALDAQDAVQLRLPGFGSPLPDGFTATMQEYADWLHRELASIAAPIDLVSHDWGALLAMRVNAQNPGLVRSWVTDMGNLDDDFEWHDTAKTWQTPGDGEAFMDGMLALSDPERAEVLAGLGVESGVADELSRDFDQVMADSILALYRSAGDVGREWGPGVDAIVAPTLVIEAAQDPFRSPGAAAALVERIGASTTLLADAGHWWMTTDPVDSAAAITAFWAGL